MSSTERAPDVIDALYGDVLAPIAAQQTVAPFPTAPDAACESYYVTRPRPAMRREDFVAPSCVDAEDFEVALAAHWRAHGRDELAAVAPRFAQAAKHTCALGDDDAEVSPFVYVMF